MKENADQKKRWNADQMCVAARLTSAISSQKRMSACDHEANREASRKSSKLMWAIN